MGTILQKFFSLTGVQIEKEPPCSEGLLPSKKVAQQNNGFKRYQKSALLIVCMLFLNVAAFANHFKGGQITYESRGNGQYMITIKSYWVNGKLDNIVPVYSGNPVHDSPMTTLSVSPLSDGTTTERVEQQLVTWANPGLYNISWTSCCRISGGSNFSMTPVGLFAAIKYDPAHPSSSPQFYDVPVFNFVAGMPMSFSLNAEDPDKHDQDVTLNTPYGVWSNPYIRMNTTGFQLGTNGDITWSNPQGGVWLVNVKFAEKINGVPTGAYVFRDFMLNVTSTTNLAPVFSPINPVSALEAQPIQFQVSVTDANGDAVALKANGLPFANGATFVQNTNGSAVTGTFSWTPPVGSARNYPLQFIATDNAGLPLSAQITVSLDVATFKFTCNLTGNAVSHNTTCPGAADGNITVNVTGGSNTYYYSIDGGNNYQASNVFQGLSAGTYDIMVNDGGSCTGTFSATVGEEPLPVVTFADQANVCLNAGTIALTNAAPAGGIFSGNGVVNNMFDPAVAGAGVHTLTYTYTNANGCANSATATILVNDAPVANAGSDQTVTLGYPQTACATLTASAVNGAGNYTYLWSNGQTTSTISVCPTTTTTYTVTITDAAGCSDVSEVTVFVSDVRCGKKNDKIVVCHNGKELCIASAAVKAHLAHGDQLGSCGSAISAGNSGINSLETAKLEAYPNPLNYETTLQFESASSGNVSLLIYDLKGNVIKNVFSGEVTAGQVYSQTVNVEGLAAGIYVATLVTPDQVQNLKMIVTR